MSDNHQEQIAEDLSEQKRPQIIQMQQINKDSVSISNSPSTLKQPLPLTSETTFDVVQVSVSSKDNQQRQASDEDSSAQLIDSNSHSLNEANAQKTRQQIQQLFKEDQKKSREIKALYESLDLMKKQINEIKNQLQKKHFEKEEIIKERECKLTNIQEESKRLLQQNERKIEELESQRIKSEELRKTIEKTQEEQFGQILEKIMKFYKQNNIQRQILQKPQQTLGKDRLAAEIDYIKSYAIEQQKKKREKITELKQSAFEMNKLKQKIKSLQEAHTLSLNSLKEQYDDKLVEQDFKLLRERQTWEKKFTKYDTFFKEEMKKKENELEKIKQKHSDQLNNLNSQITELNTWNSTAHAQIERNETEISSQKEEISSLKADLASHQDKIVELNKKIASYTQQKTELNEEVQSNKQEIYQKTLQLDKRSAELSQKQQQLTRMSEKLNTHQRRNGELEKGIEDLNATIEYKSQQYKMLLDQKQQLIVDHTLRLQQQKQLYQKNVETIKRNLKFSLETNFGKYKKIHQDIVAEKQKQSQKLTNQLKTSKQLCQQKEQLLAQSQAKLAFTEQSLEKANKIIAPLEANLWKRETELLYQIQRSKKIEEFLRQTITEGYQLKTRQSSLEFQRELNNQAIQHQRLLSEIRSKHLTQISDKEQAHRKHIDDLKNAQGDAKFHKQVQMDKLERKNKEIILKIDQAKRQTTQVLLYFQKKETQQISNGERREKQLAAKLENILSKEKMQNQERLDYLKTIKQLNKQLAQIVSKLDESKVSLASEVNKVYLLTAKLSERDTTINLMQGELQAASNKRASEIAEVKTYYESRLQSQAQNAAKANKELIQNYQYLLATKDQNLSKTITYYTSQLDKLRESSALKGDMEPLNTAELSRQIKSNQIKIRMIEEDMQDMQDKKDNQIRAIATKLALKEKELQELQKTTENKTQTIFKLEESIRCSLQIISNIEQNSQNLSFNTLIDRLSEVSHVEMSQTFKLLLASLSKREQNKEKVIKAAALKEADLMGRIALLEDEKRYIETEFSSINSKLLATTSMFNSLSSKQRQTQREKQDLNEGRQKLEINLKQFEKKVTSSSQKISKLQTQISAKTREIDDLKTGNLLLAQKTTQLVPLETKNSQLEKSLKEERQKNADFSQKIQQKELKISDMEVEMQSQLEGIRAEREKWREERQKNIETIVEYETKDIEQRKELKRLQTEQLNLNALLLEAKTGREAAEAEIISLKAKIAQLEQPSTPVRRATSQQTNSDFVKIRQMEAKIKELATNQQNLKNEIKQLKTENKSNSNKKSSDYDQDQSYYKEMLHQKTLQFDLKVAERETSLQEIKLLNEKIKKYEENSARSTLPTTPKGSRPSTVSFISPKEESSPTKEEPKPEYSLFRTDSLLMLFPDASKTLAERMKKMVRSDIESVDLIYRMGEGNNSFSPLFAKNELFERSFIFIFATKNSHTFGLAIFREFAKSKHSAFIFCLNNSQFADRKVMADDRGSIAKMEGGELVFDSGLFRVRSTYKVLQFKESNAKYFGKLNKPDLFGAAYPKETMEFELSQFQIHRVNFK